MNTGAGIAVLELYLEGKCQMNDQEYFDLYTQMLFNDPGFEPIDIPYEQLPGESEEEAIFRWLLDNGILYLVNGAVFIDAVVAEAYDPNLLKFLEALAMAEVQKTLDELENKGLVASSINAEGDLIYFLTPNGKGIAESINENN